MPLGEPLVEFDIDPAAAWPVNDERLEPNFPAAPLWMDFDDEAQFESLTQSVAEDPVVGGFADWTNFDELDLERLEEPANAPLTATRRRVSPIGVVGSVGVHVLVLLVALTWGRPTGEPAAPIPVQLIMVLETAPDNQATPNEVDVAASAPPKSDGLAPPPPPSPPPRAPSATKPKPLPPARPPKRAAAAHPALKPIKPKPIQPSPIPAREKARSSLPPPSPPRPPEATRAPRSTAERPSMPTPAIAAPYPAPHPAPEPIRPSPTPAREQVWLSTPPPSEAARGPHPTAQTPAAAPAIAAPRPAPQGGALAPAMSRDQYYAYLVALTRQHLDLLPQSVVAGRSGQTLVSIQVLRDGTITHIGIAQSSGYPDIDARIAQMVAAVGRFPPLPPSLEGASHKLEFRLVFPDIYRQQ